MKSINFINPVPPKKQRRLVFWFYSSLFLLAGVMTVIGYFHFFRAQQARQLNRDLDRLKQKAQLFDDYLAQQRELQQKKLFLEEQLTTLRSFHHQVDLSHGLLATLATITPPTICLSSVQGQPEKLLTIEGHATTAQAVTQFLKKLNNDSMITDMKLAFLTPSQETSPNGTSLMQFKFEGTWKLNQNIHLEN